MMRFRGKWKNFEMNPFMLVVKLPTEFRSLERVKGSRILRIFFTICIGLLVYSLIEYYHVTLSFLFIRASGASIPAPFVPLIPGVTIGIEILPYILAAVSIAIIVHELSHAIAAKVENVKIKSTGFLAVLALLFAAFVEVDEEDLSRKPLSTRLRVYSAGVAANLILALLFTGILTSLYMHGVGLLIVGVEPGSPAQTYGLSPGMIILSVNGTSVESKPLSELIPVEKYVNKTVTYVFSVIANGVHKVIRVVKPAGRKYIGIRIVYAPILLAKVMPANWVLGVVEFIVFSMAVNYGFALLNAAPLIITDGARALNDILSLRVKGASRRAIMYTIYAATILLLIFNINVRVIG